MSPAKTFATAGRVLSQLKRDKRTLAIIFVIPCLLITLLKYVFDGQDQLFNDVAPMLLGIFPLLMMFLVTSIATLRERTSGTLDRLMTSPISKLDFIFGYAMAFSLVGLLQACLACIVTVGLLGVTVAAGTWTVVVTAILAAFLGTTLGLFVSAFARTEFQAVELVMPILMPQILLCGLFAPRVLMAQALQWLADVFPLTYSVDAMKQVSIHTSLTGRWGRDVAVVVGCGILALILGALTIRRQE